MNLLREPLLHFVVGGALLFAGYVWLDRERTDASDLEPVRIGEGEVRWLEETWANQWLRAPSTQELQELVADLVSEELLAREAREMGLDRNDTIVRRRLAQKLKFIVEDTSGLIEPNEAELRQFYEANVARFQSGARVSFTQIFFNPALRKDASSDAKAALVELKRARDTDLAAMLGDRWLLDTEVRDADEQAVSGMFGPDFARAVFALKPGMWSEPVKSGYGIHLVSIANSSAGRQPPFEEVRDEVLQEWRREKEKGANRDYIARLREKYGVVLDDSVKELLGADRVADMAAAP
ncbi:Parvulin-like peptidyl-prolyl isomerase [Rhizobium mongolense subsp. loessense]|uniref:Parvulin-like PPIase n=1 Tax=Rhizobium mongolense subsp. loessense TaxID=158890 RepID=A0A1G4S434_9HYPH|nr:peptidylprolyl isomerase [Rhizobium mongolense]SCW63119.1 Parvulin-like peptidyl-prolyl isomerase [Rhizobium mongolense subsp. loessense]